MARAIGSGQVKTGAKLLPRPPPTPRLNKVRSPGPRQSREGILLRRMRQNCSAVDTPAIAEVRVLVDVRLVHVDQEVLVALGAGQQALELLNKGLPPLRVGSAEKLLGFLPRQLEAVQGRADRLAADH